MYFPWPNSGLIVFFLPYLSVVCGSSQRIYVQCTYYVDRFIIFVLYLSSTKSDPLLLEVEADRTRRRWRGRKNDPDSGFVSKKVGKPRKALPGDSVRSSARVCSATLESSVTHGWAPKKSKMSDLWQLFRPELTGTKVNRIFLFLYTSVLQEKLPY